MKALNYVRGMMACLAIVTTSGALAAQARPTFYGNPNFNRSSIAEPQPGVDPVLSQIMALDGAGIEWEQVALRAGLIVNDGAIVVDLAEGVSFSAEAARPEMKRTSMTPAQLQVLIDSTRTPSVQAVRLPAVNSYGDIVTEGESLMLADLYHNAGLTGKDVRIAVIDIGFAGIDGLQLAECGLVERLPNQHDLDLDASAHGTAMVEIIRDIAPDAGIVAYRIDGDLSLSQAINAAINAKADVIVSALSTFELPGQGEACQAARLAVAHGIQFVNAAGNYGDARYFEGSLFETVDVGQDTFVDFNGVGDIYQFVGDVVPGNSFSLHLAHDNAAPGAAKLALELYSWDMLTIDFNLVGMGDAEQSAQAVHHIAEPGIYYYPMVRVIEPGTVGPLRMFATDGRLHFSSTEGSIANPASVNGVISVGAVATRSYGQGGSVETFSSRGGGIFGLDITLCGPSSCTTGTYGLQAFTGTSAAAAHIGGLMALQLADKGLAADPIGLLQLTHLNDSVGAGKGIAQAQVDEFEPDNSFDYASYIGNESTTVEDHSISPGTDQDWFCFSLDEASSVRVSIKAGVGMVELYTVDADWTEVVMIASSFEGVVAHNRLAAGEYMIRMSAIDDAVSLNYMLDVVIADPKAADLRSNPPFVDSDSNEASAENNEAVAVAHQVLGAEAPASTQGEDAAGCAGSTTSRGMALMLIVMLMGAAAIRTQRKRACATRA